MFGMVQVIMQTLTAVTGRMLFNEIFRNDRKWAKVR